MGTRDTFIQTSVLPTPNFAVSPTFTSAKDILDDNSTEQLAFQQTKINPASKSFEIIHKSPPQHIPPSADNKSTGNTNHFEKELENLKRQLMQCMDEEQQLIKNIETVGAVTVEDKENENESESNSTMPMGMHFTQEAITD